MQSVEPKLNTDIFGSLSRLGTTESPFPTRTKAIAIRKGFDTFNARKRSRSKRLIRPENAQCIVDHMPKLEGDRLHAIAGGDFIFGSLFETITREERATRVYLSTLSLSAVNVDDLARSVAEERIGSLWILVSDYFSKTNQNIFTKLERVAGPRIILGVARTHAKVALFDFGKRKLVIESSANLRSSGNIEQISAFADAELFEFHREWIEGCMP